MAELAAAELGQPSPASRPPLAAATGGAGKLATTGGAGRRPPPPAARRQLRARHPQAARRWRRWPMTPATDDTRRQLRGACGLALNRCAALSATIPPQFRPSSAEFFDNRQS